MTKEQEEAIEILEDIKNNTWTTKYIMSSDSKKAETVLNMLKEKDEKIAKYEKIYKEYDCYRWVKELEKKDKQIDLMARAIDNYDSQLEINTFRDKEHIKQYFKELAE